MVWPADPAPQPDGCIWLGGIELFSPSSNQTSPQTEDVLVLPACDALSLWQFSFISPHKVGAVVCPVVKVSLCQTNGSVFGVLPQSGFWASG